MAEVPDRTVEDSDRDVPERFGTYRVEAPIGAGGMGKVYRALDEALQRRVALKTLLPSLAADPEFVARFKREAQSAASLNHPNITQIYTIGQQGPVPFFAMELIEGPSLEALVKEKGMLDPIIAAGYIVQAANGLQHAAQKGLIHRDVKPSNLMLTGEGVVKLTDFGLAKAARADTQLTATGEVLGSPGYISPEQAQGGPIDLRSDIYSLGATFYHLVVGRLPFEAPSAVAMLIKHMNEPLRSPRAVNPAIPYPIAAVVQRMMAKRPDERFQDYDALLHELERALAAAQPGSPLQAAAGPIRSATALAGARRALSGTDPARLRTTPVPPLAVLTPPQARSASWLPVALLMVIGLLVAAGIRQKVRAARELSPRPAASPTAALGTFGNRQAAGSDPPDVSEGGSLRDRLRQAMGQRNRAHLTFVSNDHEILPNGTLKIVGRVRNTGGSVATQARVRIHILREDGLIAAQGETPLDPSTIAPGTTASFELPIDYSGPFGTIKAEVAWSE